MNWEYSVVGLEKYIQNPLWKRQCPHTEQCNHEREAILLHTHCRHHYSRRLLSYSEYGVACICMSSPHRCIPSVTFQFEAAASLSIAVQGQAQIRPGPAPVTRHGHIPGDLLHYSLFLLLLNHHCGTNAPFLLCPWKLRNPIRQRGPEFEGNWRTGPSQERDEKL